MKRVLAILIGFLSSFFILLLVFFNLLREFSVYFILIAPFIGGFIAAYLAGGNYKRGAVDGLVSFLPSALILNIIIGLLLNSFSSEPIFTGSLSNILFGLLPVILIFIVFLILSALGGFLGVFTRKKL